MNLLLRPRSVITGRENLEPLHTIPRFPVFFGTVDTPLDEDLHADMEWVIDRETGVVQLAKLIPLEVLYREQHVDGCGPLWAAYYADFASYLLARDPGRVAEIGGGSGAFALTALAQKPDLDWTIVEPNPTVAPMRNLRVIKGFFDRNVISADSLDTVVFSQVMEHVYEPRQFLADIAEVLRPGQRLIFAYPNLALWLERKYTNALNFEHTMLLTDRHLDALLPQHGFRVLDKTVYKEHSFFYSAEKVSGSVSGPKMPQLYTEYKALFLDFVKHHERMVAAINESMRYSDHEFYLFGAHIFSTFLFAFGLRPERISGILDNSPTKRGRRLYGTNFIIQSPSVLAGRSKVSVILRAGHFNREIREDIERNINADVAFV